MMAPLKHIGEGREMPFGKHGRGSIIKDLVREEKYSEITSLASKNRNVALELIELFEDPESEMRERAAEAIGRIGRDDLHAPEAVKIVIPQLANLLGSSKSQVREVATLALLNIAWNWLMWEDIGEIIRPVLPWFIKLLYDADAKVRQNALEAVKVAAEWIEDKGEKEDIKLIEPVLPQLSTFLKDSESRFRGDSVWALRAIAHRNPEMVKPMVGEIVGLLKDSKDHIRLGASATLTYIAEAYPETVRSALPSILILLEDPYCGVCQNAAISLGFIAGEISEVAELVVPKLTELLRDGRPLFRADAARALASIGGINPEMIKLALPQLRKLLEDDDGNVRESAIKAIKSIDNKYI